MEAMCRSQRSGAAAFGSMIDFLVAETALAAERSLLWLLLAMVSISRQTLTPVEGPEEIYRMLAKSTQEVVPDNRDDGESDDNDDEDDDNDDGGEDQDADGGEEDYSGEENDNEGDENDDPEANGEGGSEEDDDEEDDEEDDEDDEEDEEDEEEDEEVPQPPTKKRK